MKKKIVKYISPLMKFKIGLEKFEPDITGTIKVIKTKKREKNG